MGTMTVSYGMWWGGSPEGIAGGLWSEGAHNAGCMVPQAVQQVPARMVAQRRKRCTSQLRKSVPGPRSLLHGKGLENRATRSTRPALGAWTFNVHKTSVTADDCWERVRTSSHLFQARVIIMSQPTGSRPTP